MSRETLAWLNRNVLVGYVDVRGTAWHHQKSAEGEEPNHYTGPVPIEDVKRRLFHWTAEPRDLMMLVPDGRGGTTPVPLDSHRAIVRNDSNEVLSVRSANYAIHQYGEVLLESVAHLLDDDLNIGSAGLLRRGGVAWVQIEAPENCVAAEGLEFRPHLLAATSHDGSIATTYKRVATIVVCDNTLAMGLREGRRSVSGEETTVDGEYKVKHTAGSKLRLLDARTALKIVFDMGEAYKAELNDLLSVKVSDHDWMRFLEAHIPIAEDATDAKKVNALVQRHAYNDLWNEDPRVAPWRNTALGVLQAVNTYRHHLLSARGGTVRHERNKLDAILAIGKKKDAKALSVLMDLVS
jgi:phage/plasmid-like protein (TIGR03299 family)